MTIDEQIDQAINQRRDDFLETLFRLLRQPSISTQGVGVDECARLVRDVLVEHGIDARLIPTDGFPVVYGELLAGEGANTILIYGHYDVQPPEPYDAWITPPFEPAIRDGRIYARGSGDNKGQFLAHVLAIKLLSDLGQLPRVNIKFLLEGEEENGSPNLPAFVERHADLLRADFLYAADGPAHFSGRPVVFCGMRGTLKMELEATGANRDLHSGNFGGPVPNAVWRLINLLSSMRDAEGRVRVEGFYDGVVSPSDHERELMARIPFDEREFKENLGIENFDGPADQSYFEKIMFQPTLTVTGIAGGYTGQGVKMVIPSKAIAKMESRLVVNQDPDQVFAAIERHVRRHAPDITIRNLGATRPSKTSPDLPVARMVMRAIGRAYGVEPVVMPVLGAASPNYLFTDVLKIPSIWATYGPHDENNHAPNENITLASFFNGIRASAEVIREFAALPREDLSHPPLG